MSDIVCLLQIFIDCLAKVFCVYVPEPSSLGQPASHVTYTMGRRKQRKSIRSPVLKNNKFDPTNENYKNSPMVTRSHADQTQIPAPVPGYSSMAALEQEVKYIKCLFKQFQNKLYESDARGRVIMEWRLVAQVLDRILFSIYITTIVVSIGSILIYSQFNRNMMESINDSQPTNV